MFYEVLILAELHSCVFLRPNWNCNPGSIHIMYKHASQRADVFMLSVSFLLTFLFIFANLCIIFIFYNFTVPV